MEAWHPWVGGCGAWTELGLGPTMWLRHFTMAQLSVSQYYLEQSADGIELSSSIRFLILKQILGADQMLTLFGISLSLARCLNVTSFF